MTYIVEINDDSLHEMSLVYPYVNRQKWSFFGRTTYKKLMHLLSLTNWLKTIQREHTFISND
jgi:hypothetical protein